MSDSDHGMSEAARLQAIDAFFTTKERGKGTGLGLSMVYGYATQLGGTAHVYSQEGGGTTVRLYLPLDSEKYDEEEEKRLASLGTGGILTPIWRRNLWKRS